MERKIFTYKMIECLYTEAMVLADEARSYFKSEFREDYGQVHADRRIQMSCESLRVTTRLMHSIAWLLNQKALLAGELDEHDLRNHNRTLGRALPSDPDTVSVMPKAAQKLVADSEALYNRLIALEKAQNIKQCNDARMEREADCKTAVHDMHQQISNKLLGHFA